MPSPHPSTRPEADQAPDDQQPGFADLGIDRRVLLALADVGYESPSPIQAATIPALLAGRHVVGLAQTGTGKTAAFAVPILSRLDLRQKAPQALVLAPTRELALQVSEAFERYAAHLPGVHVLPIYGGQAYGVQLSALRRGVHVVVGTPGRVMDHLDKGTLDLSELRFLVLDEADEMLKMGFAEDVETILSGTPEDKHVALFSATMPAQIRRIAKRYLTDAAEITVRNRTTTSANTNQRYLTVAHPQKLDALTRILEVESFEGMIVFVRTKQVTEQLAERLPRRSTATSSRRSASGPSTSSARRSSTSWWPPTWRPAASTSSGSPTWSTTTSPPTPSPTCTGSAAPDASAGPARRSRSSPRARGTCSRRSNAPPASR
jgi:ATP-dependent RNA helicase DeaD